MAWSPVKPGEVRGSTDRRPAPTPEEIAKDALASTHFEWDDWRNRAEKSVAAAIREDRARIRAVADRARLLLPAVLRDLYWELGPK